MRCGSIVAAMGGDCFTGSYPWASFFAFSTASSMVPTM